jgi:hypothetical protein
VRVHANARTRMARWIRPRLRFTSQ